MLLTYTKDLATYLRTWYRRLGGKSSHLTITHFHKWCRDQLQPLGAWQEPLDEASRRGLIARLQRQVPGAEIFTVEFLAEELQWLKESLSRAARSANCRGLQLSALHGRGPLWAAEGKATKSAT